MVVSSVTPLMPAATSVQRWGSLATLSVRSCSTTPHSSESSSVGSGTTPVFSYSRPLCTSMVASPPSSRIMLGPEPSGQRRAWSVHHQYSSSVSPFQAKTGTPWGASVVPLGPTAMAAAAWSWVEKMLQDTQRTSAPRAVRVSMSTAVWMVMCSEPMILAPASGWASANSARVAMRPGISCSASWISLRPKLARERSATLKSSGFRMGTGFPPRVDGRGSPGARCGQANGSSCGTGACWLTHDSPRGPKAVAQPSRPGPGGRGAHRNWNVF